MKLIQKLFFVFTIVAFVVGGYVYSTMDIVERLSNMEQYKESLVQKEAFSGMMPQFSMLQPESFQDSEKSDTPIDESCPDLLIKSGDHIELYNTRKPAKAGENPLHFKNLDEYIKYLEGQPKTGCPVLFLQKENDAQGNDVYRSRPNIFDTGAGLPITSQLKVGVNAKPIQVVDASRETGYNQNNYAGFDPYGLYVGRVTNVDEIGHSTEKGNVSENPMDPNWGGVLYTQKAVDSGKYDDNAVSRITYPTPKTEFIPIPNSSVPPLPPAVN